MGFSKMLRLRTLACLKETVIWLPGNSKQSDKIDLCVFDLEEYEES